MNLKSVGAFFAGSIFPEEYRGSYDESFRLIEAAEQSEPRPHTAEQAATIAISKTLLYSFCGNFAKADTALQDVMSCVEHLEKRWLLRIQTYSLYRLYLRRFSPVLLFRSEIGSTMSTILDIVLDTDKVYENAREFNQTNINVVTVMDRLELSLILNVFSFPHLLRGYLLVWHSGFPKGLFNSSGTAIEYKHVKSFLAKLKIFREWAELTGVPALLGRLDHLMLEIKVADPACDGLSILENHARQVTEEGELSSAAWCKMRHADALLSPNFTSPISMNLIALDSADAGYTSYTWDEPEDRLRLRSNDTTHRLYDEAYNLYKHDGSTRGCAAILPRMACTIHAEKADLLQESPCKIGLLEKAREYLHEAIQFFGIDETNVHIAKGHQILIDLALGNWSSVKQNSEAIRVWGAQSQNIMICHFVCMLMMRYGRRQWLRRSKIDLALMCYDCAYALFAKTGDEVAKLQCLIAHMQIQGSISNHVVVRSMAEGGTVASASCLNNAPRNST
jgi:hypothetical protein